MPPFKADHVGSLLRPKSILDARAAHQDGKLSAGALSDIEAKEIARIVGKQKDIGLKLATDGDFRRRHWFMDFIERIDGVRFAEPMAVRPMNARGALRIRSARARASSAVPTAVQSATMVCSATPDHSISEIAIRPTSPERIAATTRGFAIAAA